MRKKGNGNPEICVQNLVSIRRGEVAYERVKGINPELIDRPLSLAESEVIADAETQIEIFEPRVIIDDTAAGQDGNGDLNFEFEMHRKEETT